MIVVLGRPRVYRPEPDGELAPGGLGVEVALALGRTGVAVELVGSVGDDPEGDRVVVELGRAGVGHAALLRDPSTRTPPLGEEDAVRGAPAPRRSRRRAGTALRCRLPRARGDRGPRPGSAPSSPGRRRVPRCGGGHGRLGRQRGPGRPGRERHAARAPRCGQRPMTTARTPIRHPTPGPWPRQEAAFAGLVADYARRLDRGEAPAQAFMAALDGGAWEPSAD